MLGREDGKAVLDGGCVGVAEGLARVSFAEYGDPGDSPVDGLSESLLAFLDLGGVLLDMLFGGSCKRCQLEVGRFEAVCLLKGAVC